MILTINGLDYVVIVFASDCFECPMCGEPVCPLCKVHYFECDCPGPDSEELADYDHSIEYYDAVSTCLIKIKD